MVDHRVRRLEDRPGRAVVLLELDDLGVGEVALEVEDVADVGVAEAVDRLVVVADDHQVAVLLGEQLEQPVLGVVGVLVLVDEDVAQGAPQRSRTSSKSSSALTVRTSRSSKSRALASCMRFS